MKGFDTEIARSILKPLSLMTEDEHGGEPKADDGLIRGADLDFPLRVYHRAVPSLLLLCSMERFSASLVVPGRMAPRASMDGGTRIQGRHISGFRGQGRLRVQPD